MTNNTLAEIAKPCSLCKEVSRDFSPRKGRKSGLHSWCRTCERSGRNARSAERRLTPVPRSLEAKQCSRCKEVKPAEGFYTNGLNADGLQGYCQPCAKVEYFRWLGIELKDGQYETLLAEQDSSCAICKRPDPARSLAVDHDHATGEIRGLLCSRCNRALGFFQDSPVLLRAAAEYLER